MLTAIPFGLIHLPLAFEGDGRSRVPWSRPSSTGFPSRRHAVPPVMPHRRTPGGHRAELLAVGDAARILQRLRRLVVRGCQTAGRHVPALVILTVLATVHPATTGRSLVDARVDPCGAQPPPRSGRLHRREPVMNLGLRHREPCSQGPGPAALHLADTCHEHCQRRQTCHAGTTRRAAASLGTALTTLTLVRPCSELLFRSPRGQAPSGARGATVAGRSVAAAQLAARSSAHPDTPTNR